MRALTLAASGGIVLTEIDEPSADATPATLVAAAVNPVDRVIATGTMPFRPLAPGAVAGLSGVVQDAAGGLLYVSAPPAPFGTFADVVPLRGTESVPVPDGLDPVTAAAIGVPGIAAWLALHRAAQTQPGETVLVLGGTGSAGTLAVAAAVDLGATVLATARTDAGLDAIAARGARGVLAADADALDAQLAAAGGIDVVIDLTWGMPLAVAVRHLATGARIAQVGNSAGAEASILAPAFRNRGARIIGHSNFLASAAEREIAYTAVADLVLRTGPRPAAPTRPLAEGVDALAQAGAVVLVP
ncbi:MULTISPECIES: quinone oxidoreductase family protein [Microbacterium]|uniref:quinone oxidoreductase family protein n=1 Tax=Microbacterium TaxID=33882 RepID=UPI0010F98C86|nr:zinc-binding dehydrogenase [Microbacterium sp. 4NA327F11]MCK9916430.1 zinc-binding dehydrogenase [Microbacteriaceae bacterium K1510]